MTLVPLVLSPERTMLRDTIRGFGSRFGDGVSVRAAIDSELGYEESVWRLMSEQLGLQGLAVPEEYGGSGFGPVESFLVFAELGRTLPPAPYFSTIALAASVLLEVGDAAARKQYLPALADGSVRATVAICEDSGSWSPDAVAIQARPDADGGHLITGVKRYVIDAQTADAVVVIARHENGVGAFVIDADAPGVVIEPLVTLDLTRRQGVIRMERTPAQLISGAGDATAGLSRALDRAVLALVAEQCGGAEHLLESARAYAELREQFGRPIGSFQAIKHKLADMAFDTERMWAAAWQATRAAEADDPDLAVAVSLAKSFCSEAYFRLAAENIQIHGGIGFTWEHEAHLYFRRAKSSEVILGSPVEHRRRLLHELGA